MPVTINGIEEDVSNIYLSDYMKEHDINPARVVIEINENIIPPANYGKYKLMDKDRVEIIQFVGGG